MGKLFYLIGKSSTGKDTIFQSLLEREDLGLKPLVLYTTRPMRAGETPGVQYHFTDENGLAGLEAQGGRSSSFGPIRRFTGYGNISRQIRRLRIWNAFTISP